MPKPMGGPAPRKNMTDGIPKPKGLKEVPGYLFKRIKGFLSRLFYIISLVWKASPGMLILMCLLCLANGVLPVVGAYISKDLLNAIAALLSGGESLSPDNWFTGALSFGVPAYLFIPAQSLRQSG